MTLKRQNVTWLSGNVRGQAGGEEQDGEKLLQVSLKIEELQEKKYLLDSINSEHESLHQKIMEVRN